MQKQKIGLLSIILMLAIILQACGPTATPQMSSTAEVVQPTPTPEPIKLKVVVLPFLAYAPFFIAEEEGYYAEQGLEVEIVRMDLNAQFTPLLATGEVDIAAGLLDINTLNAMAQGSNIKYVADKGYFDPEATCAYTGWIVRKELLESGQLDDLKNLAGLKIAASFHGANHYFLDSLLMKGGLTEEDVEIVDIPVPNRLETMRTGDLDISGAAEPWVLRMTNAGVGENWRPWEQDFPGFAFSMLLFGPNLLDKNPEVGKRFMVAFMKAVEFYNQGKTDRNVEIIAKYTQLEPEEVKASCWQSIRTDGQINTDSLLEFQAWGISRGFLVTELTVEQMWDPTFVEHASQVLGIK